MYPLRVINPKWGDKEWTPSEEDWWKATEQYRAAEQHAREIAELLLRYTDKEHVC